MAEKRTDKRKYPGINAGLLAFQGDYSAHRRVLANLGVNTLEVRTRPDIEKCTHLIIPGGESTTFLKLLEFRDLTSSLKKHISDGKPLFVTCAGLILLAKKVIHPAQESLGLLDITVERNAYGSQVESFTAGLEIPAIGKEKFPGVFIRAPRIVDVEESVETLAEFEGDPVVIRQGNILGMTFHPELTDDTRLHEMFLGLPG